jgi:ankyrin repeat protein
VPGFPGTDVTVTPFDDTTIAFAHYMFDLARFGDAPELIANVTDGLPPDLANDRGDTLLIVAAYHDHPETVAALLAHGADPNRVNHRGQTALSAAVFRRNPITVRTLLAAGADPDGGGPSALAVADHFRLPEMAALLR